MAEPNFPQPPGRSGGSSSFPSDLVSSGRDFSTSISFITYDFYQATGIGSISMAGESVTLPLPRKINDVETILWEEFSATAALGSGLQTGGQIASMVSPKLGRVLGTTGGVTSAAVSGLNMAGLFTGETVNPFMFMMFKRPGFKEYNLHWTLAPNNQKDSDNLKQIIKTCKAAALPQGYSYEGGAMKYPKVAMVKFKPDDYLFKIKPCAIVSVAVDYTGSNGPSFFKNGAPTVVNLSIALKEMQLRDAQTAE